MLTDPENQSGLAPFVLTEKFLSSVGAMPMCPLDHVPMCPFAGMLVAR